MELANVSAELFSPDSATPRS